MQLKIREVINLHAALQKLDTYQNDGKEFPFTLGAIRLDIARNIRVLNPSVEAYNKARNDLLKQITNGTGMLAPDAPAESRSQFAEEIEKMMESSDDFKLYTIKQADLKLDINPINSTVLAIMLDTGVLVD